MQSWTGAKWQPDLRAHLDDGNPGGISTGEAGPGGKSVDDGMDPFNHLPWCGYAGL